MNLEQFKKYIKQIDAQQLDAVFDEISAKMKKARSAQTRLGYAMALDAMVIEKNMRQHPVDVASINIDELFAELSAL